MSPQLRDGTRRCSCLKMASKASAAHTCAAASLVALWHPVTCRTDALSLSAALVCMGDESGLTAAAKK